MKIKEIRAFPIKPMIAGGTYSADAPGTTPRRDPWTKDAEVASPMSRYPRYKRLRASWRPKLSEVGVIAIAEDGTFGPRDAPGFGIDLTLEDVEALAG